MQHEPCCNLFSSTMYKKLIITLFYPIFILLSCKVLIEKRYGMNRPFRFETKNEYTNYLSGKGFPSSNMLVIDSSSIDAFAQALAQNQQTVYYGCFLNDTTELKKTESVKENLGCAGRILNDVSLNINKVHYDSSLLIKSNFNEFVFRKLIDDSKFNMNESEKQLKIIMVYSYSLGSYYDSMYTDIIHFYKENIRSTDLYIISLDPVNRLQ